METTIVGYLGIMGYRVYIGLLPFETGPFEAWKGGD